MVREPQRRNRPACSCARWRGDSRCAAGSRTDLGGDPCRRRDRAQRGTRFLALSRPFERAVDRAGLGDGISAHNLRHTFASILIVGLGLDPVRVSKQLGHSRPSVTLDTYSHLFEQRHAAGLRDALDAGFGHLLEGNGVVTAADNTLQQDDGKVAQLRRS